MCLLLRITEKNMFGRYKGLLKLIKNKYKKTDKNFWLFSSYGGRKYDDSPKVVSEYIHKHYPNIHIYWLLEKELFDQVPSYVLCLDVRNANDRAFAFENAAVIIDNIYGPQCSFLFEKGFKKGIYFAIDKFFKKRKYQTVYSFWHGFGVKKGMNEQGNLRTVNISVGNLYFLLPSKSMIKHFKKITQHCAKGYVLNGTPRNDILFNTKLDKSALKKKLGIPSEKKVILYAPTFRGNTKEWTFDIRMSGIDQLKMMDINLLLDTLSLKFGGDFVLVVRIHHLVEDSVNFKDLMIDYSNKVFLGNVSPDMSDYLCISDVLLTDFSSSPADFVLTKKPIFLFVPDYQDYKNKYGLSRELETFPYPYSVTFDDLIEKISTFDYSLYNKKINEYFIEEGFDVTNGSTEKAVNFIMKNLK